MAKLLVVKLKQFSDEPEGRRCGVLYVHVCCTSGARENIFMAWHARDLLSDSA